MEVAKANTIIQKEAPVRKRGEKYSLKDNQALDRTKVKLGVPENEKLLLRLVTTKGNTNEYLFPGKIPDSAWNDPAFIAHVNDWREQVLRRAWLNMSPRWTKRQHDFLCRGIKKHMVKTKMKTGMKLSADDWRAIAQQQNEMFKGKRVRVGEKLMNGKQATTK